MTYQLKLISHDMTNGIKIYLVMKSVSKTEVNYDENKLLYYATIYYEWETVYRGTLSECASWIQLDRGGIIIEE